MCLKSLLLHPILPQFIKSIMTITVGAILMKILFPSRLWPRGKYFTKAEVRMEFIQSTLTRLHSFLCLLKLCSSVSSSTIFNKTLWHLRLGHPSDQALKHLFPNAKLHLNKCTAVDNSYTHC